MGCSDRIRKSVINIVQECENGHAHLQQLEDKQCCVREEQQQHQEQLAKFLVQFQEEVHKTEKLQQAQTVKDQTIEGPVGGTEEPKNFKPQALPPFSRADPVPKDEASCGQWVCQVKEMLKSCTVGAVRIAIVQSVRGEVREFAAAVGFKASVEMLLEKIEELFRETVEAEKEKVPEVKITSLKGKSAIAGEDNTGIQDLKQKIDALTTVVTSSTFRGARRKQPRNGATPQKGKDNGKVNGSLYKGWGLATTSAGPFKPGQKHFQCYHCWRGGKMGLQPANLDNLYTFHI